MNYTLKDSYIIHNINLPNKLYNEKHLTLPESIKLYNLVFTLNSHKKLYQENAKSKDKDNELYNLTKYIEALHDLVIFERELHNKYKG